MEKSSDLRLEKRSSHDSIEKGNSHDVVRVPLALW